MTVHTKSNEVETLEMGVYGIEISYYSGDIGGASITSTMKEEDTPENALFNAGVDGIESLILAHFCAGTDILSPDYLEGIETAYQAIGNNL